MIQNDINGESNNKKAKPGKRRTIVKKKTLQPTKPRLVPASHLKPFFLNRILIDSKKQHGLYWKKIRQIEDFDFSEIDKNFSQQVAEKIINKEEFEPEKNIISGHCSSLPSKKSQSIEIFFRSQKISIREICHKVYTMQLDIDDDYLIKFLQDNHLTTQEAENITLSGTSAPIGEQNMLKVYKIPLSDLRLRIINLPFKNISNLYSYKESLWAANDFLTEISSNVFLEEFLSMILTSVNYINANNENRNRADGFELDLLRRLVSYRSNNKNENLLEVVVRRYIAVNINEIHSLHLYPPYPDPKNTSLLEGFAFAPILEGLNEIKSNINELQELVNQLVMDKSIDPQDYIFTKGAEIIQIGMANLTEAESLYKNTKSQFEKLLLDFGDKTIESETCPEKEFISCWKEFFTSLNTIWLRETSQHFKKFYIEMENLLKSRREQLTIRTRPKNTDSTSLKNRIKRMSLSSNHLPK